MLYTLVVIATLSDLTAGDPTQPENMTCVLYARRLLTCTYDLRDDVDRSNTTCTTCSQFSHGDQLEKRGEATGQIIDRSRRVVLLVGASAKTVAPPTTTSTRKNRRPTTICACN